MPSPRSPFPFPVSSFLLCPLRLTFLPLALAPFPYLRVLLVLLTYSMCIQPDLTQIHMRRASMEGGDYGRRLFDRVVWNH